MESWAAAMFVYLRCESDNVMTRSFECYEFACRDGCGIIYSSKLSSASYCHFDIAVTYCETRKMRRVYKMSRAGICDLFMRDEYLHRKSDDLSERKCLIMYSAY